MGLFDNDKKKDQEKFGLFSFMNENSKKDNKSEYSEKDLDHLEDWQKDLVRKGEYEPYDFEEDEIDDDSYYSEDD